jgi:hypothetical protein
MGLLRPPCSSIHHRGQVPDLCAELLIQQREHKYLTQVELSGGLGPHSNFTNPFESLLIILLEVWSVARKYAFNPPKVRFLLNTKLPTNATGKSEKTVG